MSTEMLSYFLKNEDQKTRLGFQVALQCAPLLKGLKISCLISVDAALYPSLAAMFSGVDIAYRCLSRSGEKCLVFFYRPEELDAYLQKAEVQRFLREYGYGQMNTAAALDRLSGRMQALSGSGSGESFPHEVGVFLGYPVEDVRGFIENEGRQYLLLGYWKVYSDLSRARMTFKKYDRAKDCAVQEFLTGKSIREIAQSK